MTPEMNRSLGSPPERRTQPRVEARIQVRLAPATGSESVDAQNIDLSWGGASLLLPDTRLQVGESVKLEFPWTPGRSFYARAEVIRCQESDAGYVTGVRFSKLLVRHETRLERLLGLLIDPRQHAGELALSPQIDIDFMDVDGVASALEEIRGGRYQVTSFRPYEPDQSLMLVLIWQGRLPLLRLRARVTESRAVHAKRPHLTGAAAAQTPALYQTDLTFEHPLGDLIRTIDPLTDRLTERGYRFQSAA